MGERFWLDETDPAELFRRADNLERDGLLAMAAEFRWRAKQIDAPVIFKTSREGHPQ